MESGFRVPGAAPFGDSGQALNLVPPNSDAPSDTESVSPATTAPSSARSTRIADRLFRGTTRFFAVFVLLVMAALLLTLVDGAWPALRKFGFGFVIGRAWNPVTERFGALTTIYGTLITSAIALLFGVPISFGIALFVTELCPRWLRRPLSTAVELLAAIPSIIFGMWGLFVVAPFLADHFQPWATDHLGGLPLVGRFFQGPPLGIGIFTASIILAIMIIPFISSVMRDVFETVPAVLKESSYALGSTTWEVTWHIVLPYTRVGVAGGIMLGLGRAMGETMAVTFVIGNAHDLSASLFMPGSTISSTLANEFTEAVGDLYTSSLIGLGLILFVITFVVIAFSKWMLHRLEARQGKAA